MFEQAADTIKNKKMYLRSALPELICEAWDFFKARQPVGSREILERDVFCGQFTISILVNITMGQVNHKV